MTTDERARFEQAVQAWKEHDMPIREVCGSNTGLDICAWIRVQHAQAQGRLRLVCVDYLQLIAGGAARLSENDRLGEITRSLKLVALELGVCILLLSQMNRESAKESRLPRLSDLRGSGNIEQDADSVIFLHGPDAPGEPTVVVQAMVCKNRGGPTGDVQLTFHKRDGQRFTQVGAPSASHGSGKPPMERREDPGDVFSTTAITTNDEGATP
jgi:replicative DNA helicase